MLFYEGHFKLASIKWSQENYKHTQKKTFDIYIRLFITYISIVTENDYSSKLWANVYAFWIAYSCYILRVF